MVKYNEFMDNAKKQLNEQMLTLFDIVISERKKYFEENPIIADKEKVKDIIKKYANINFSIVGAINLIPGPMGMLAIFPEITTSINNQLKMIYDISQAYGKDKLMNKELMAGIFLSSLGANGIGLLAMHGGKILVKRTSLRVFQKIAVILGTKLLQRTARALVAKYLPIIGAAAMAVWSRYTTKELGNYALKILENEIVHTDEEIQDVTVDTDYSVISNVTNLEINLDVLKIEALINLMKIDKEIHEKEIEYIQIILDSLDINKEIKESLLNNLTTNKTYDVDYNQFNQSIDLLLGLISDLVGLAKRDGKIRPEEKISLKKIAKILNISEQEIDELLVITN